MSNVRIIGERMEAMLANLKPVSEQERVEIRQQVRNASRSVPVETAERITKQTEEIQAALQTGRY